MGVDKRQRVNRFVWVVENAAGGIFTGKTDK
jgi:hypothetical protein